jgi:transcription antitermination factor NusG
LPEITLTDSFVLRTQQHRERWAAENIFRQGRRFYLPTIVETVRTVKRGNRQREFVTKPLFPGYLFVDASSGQWHELLTAFGVTGIVAGASDRPAIIHAVRLREIHAMEGQDGNVRLVSASLLRAGQTARITSGSYTGFLGVVQGMSANDRVQILLDYMGRKVPFLVRYDNLELVA